MSITQLQFDFVPQSQPINNANFVDKLTSLHIAQDIILKHLDTILPHRSYGFMGERVYKTDDGQNVYSFGDENWNDLYFKFKDGYLVSAGLRIDFRTPKMFIDQIDEITRTYQVWLRPFANGTKIYKEYITNPIIEIPEVMDMYQKDMKVDANLRDM